MASFFQSLFIVVSFILMLIENCNSFSIFTFIGVFKMCFNNLLTVMILKPSYVHYDIEVILEIYAIRQLIALN